MHSIAQNGNETKIGNKAKDLLDPNLLKSAREIYYNYCHFHRKVKRTPIGVAIDRKTHKGQLLFSKSPILLPREYFIPISQIESANH